MAKATGKLAQWRMTLSEFEFDIINRAAIERQAADALSHLKTKGEDGTSLDDKVPVLAISQKRFAYAPKTKTRNLKFLEKPKRPFIPFIPKVYMVVGITDN